MPVARTSLCEALEEGRAAYSGAAWPVVVPGQPAAVPDPEPAPTLHALPSLGGAKGLWKGLCALPEAAEGSYSQMAAEGQKPHCILLNVSQVYLKALPTTVVHIPNAFPHNLNPLSISKACSFLVGRMHLIPFFSIGMLHLIATPN